MAEAPAGSSASDSKEGPLVLAVLAALIYEVRPFLGLVKAGRRQDLNLPAWEFQAGEGRGLAAVSGVGEAAARRAAAQLLTIGRPRLLLSIGFGGGLTSGVQPGAVMVGSSYWHYSPKTGTVREVVSPLAPFAAADLENRLINAGLPALAGSLVTAPAILRKAEHLPAFQHLTHPVLDLETSAVAAVAAAHGVAFLGMRAVTDVSGEEIPHFMAEALNAHKTPGPGIALGWLAHDPRRVVQLIHFWRRGRLAARNLARAVEVLLPLLNARSFLPPSL